MRIMNSEKTPKKKQESYSGRAIKTVRPAEIRNRMKNLFKPFLLSFSLSETRRKTGRNLIESRNNQEVNTE